MAECFAYGEEVHRLCKFPRRNMLRFNQLQCNIFQIIVWCTVYFSNSRFCWRVKNIYRRVLNTTVSSHGLKMDSCYLQVICQNHHHSIIICFIIYNFSLGERWEKDRRMLTTTFHFHILDEFFDADFNRNDVILNEEIERKMKTHKEIDINPLLSACTLDVICGYIIH